MSIWLWADLASWFWCRMSALAYEHTAHENATACSARWDNNKKFAPKSTKNWPRKAYLSAGSGMLSMSLAVVLWGGAVEGPAAAVPLGAAAVLLTGPAVPPGPFCAAWGW